MAGTLAKEAIPKMKVVTINISLLSTVRPTSSRETIIAKVQNTDAFCRSLSEDRPPKVLPTIKPTPTTTRIQVTALSPKPVTCMAMGAR
ncbi:MAG: hypothetical protein SPiBPW_29730 [Shewanella algae]